MHCRRTQVLRYFDEEFHHKNCHKRCDVCVNGCVTTRDVTAEAIDAINLVKSFPPGLTSKVTSIEARNIFLGNDNKRKKNLDEKLKLDTGTLSNFGKGKALGSLLVDRLFEELYITDVLQEFAVLNSSGYKNYYLKPVSCYHSCFGIFVNLIWLQIGLEADEVLQSRTKVLIYVKENLAVNRNPNASDQVSQRAKGKQREHIFPLDYDELGLYGSITDEEAMSEEEIPSSVNLTAPTIMDPIAVSIFEDLQYLRRSLQDEGIVSEEEGPSDMFLSRLCIERPKSKSCLRQ